MISHSMLIATICSRFTHCGGKRSYTKHLVRADAVRQTVGLFVFLLIFALVSTLAPTNRVLAHDNIHVVQPGETLSEIALRYGVTDEALRQLNNLNDVDFVWVGQTLVLPESIVTDSTTDVVETTDFTSVRTTGTTIYIVQPNDTLSAIAVAYRISLAQLVELNRISPAQRLYSGQSLYVPSTTAAPSTLDDGTDGARQDTAGDQALHVVQRGEQLGNIAGQYGVSMRAIALANTLVDANLITPGQRLVIPGSDFAEQTTGVMPDSNAFHSHESPLTANEKWIDVDLSEQRVVAYEGTTPVNTFIISSGLPGTPTVTGTFRIWTKTPLQDMYGGNRAAGDYYYLKDVQWVQYFYEDYAFHGTYWHNNFGQPMSRGCINMRNEDAKWLFNWAGPNYDWNGPTWQKPLDANQGTMVLVHE